MLIHNPRRMLIATFRPLSNILGVLWEYEGRQITKEVIYMLVLDRLQRKHPQYRRDI